MQKKPALTLQQRVRLCLVEKGMTQESLAHELGIHNSKLSRILRGFQSPTTDEADALAKFTGIPASDFAEAS